ncbi:MAG: nucleotidyltransferase family protein [Actinomycetota bacterium]|nr:nucleotidyltransferase family protein [Actinomycetota bacterium]
MIAGLILAAGAGSRFDGDGPKQLASLHGRPLLEHAVRAQQAVPGLERIIVVLGSCADEIGEAVDFGDAEAVVCPSWADGQGASLRHGVCELHAARKVLLTLGDAPLITPRVIARFVTEPPGTRAAYDGAPGHPVVLGPELLRAAAALQPHETLRDVDQQWRMVECGHLCSGRDVDTTDDLEAMRHEARAVL